MKRRPFQLGIVDRYVLREVAGGFAAAGAILVLVLAFPQGIVGGLLALAERLGWRGGATTGARG